MGLHWVDSHFGFGSDLDPIPAAPVGIGQYGEANEYRPHSGVSTDTDQEWFERDFDPLQQGQGVSSSLPRLQPPMGAGLPPGLMHVGRGSLPRMPAHGRIGKAPAKHPMKVGRSLPPLAKTPNVSASMPVVVPAGTAGTAATAGTPAVAVSGDLDDVYYAMEIATAHDPFALGG